MGGPINDSPRNDGLEQTPPVTPAEVWDFDFSTPEEFPELGEEGGAPMGGPVYRYDEDATGDGQFPDYYDGTAFFYEWNQDYIKQFTLTDDGTALDEIRDFVPDWDFSAPMDMEFGPDGAMYLLEYGSGFFVESEEARLTRIAFDPDAEEPGQPVPPQPVTATLDPEEPDGEDGWYASPVTVTIESEDDVDELQWRLADDEEWETDTDPVTFDENGEYDVEYRAVYPPPDEDGDPDGTDEADEADAEATEEAADVESEVTVEAVNFEFDPDEITVAEGGTVTFEQVAGAHNVLVFDEDGEQVESQEEIGGWETFEWEAEEAGTFTFDCTPHDGMDGTIEVVSADATGDAGEGDEPRGEPDTSESYSVDFAIAIDGDPAATDEPSDAAPDTVEAGSGDLADSGLPSWVAGLMALGAITVATPVTAAIRRRG